MRRLFWAAAGLAAGAILAQRATRWIGKTRERLAPPALARDAGERVAGLAERLRDAVEAGREEMERREAELRAELGLPD